jgi:collagenase-like PrtC family protease
MEMNTPQLPRLTMGPLLFHWPAEKRRDFYYRIADEAPIDTVYLGEVVCSKREHLFAPFIDSVVARLRAAGKEIVMSTLALVTSKREVAAIRELAESGVLVEANDVACVQLLAARPHVIGPYINVFNEGARDFLINGGATRIVLPVEIPEASIATVAATDGRADIEVQVFGRQPLSVAMRCYHARSHNLTKDHCHLVCGHDPDGLAVSTIDGVDILAVNGTQTLSYGYCVLIDDLALLREAGVTHFRLSPQDVDMVRVAELYRDVLDGQRTSTSVFQSLRSTTGDIPYVNGFLKGREGRSWV